MKLMMTSLAALLSLSIAGSAQASYGGGGYASTPRTSAKKSATPRAKKAKGENLAKKRPKGGSQVTSGGSKASSGGYGGGYGGSGGGY